MEIIKNYVQQNKERFINELIDLLKIPSVSADSAYSQDVLNTADKVKEFLETERLSRIKQLEDLDETFRLKAEEIMSEAEAIKNLDSIGMKLELRNLLIESHYELIKLKSFNPE